jgi:hypothetical protein
LVILEALVLPPAEGVIISAGKRAPLGEKPVKPKRKQLFL